MPVRRFFPLLLFCLVILAGIAAPQETTDSTSLVSGVASDLAGSVRDAQPEWSFTVGKLIWSLIVLVVAYVLIKYLTRLFEVVSERWTNLRLTIKGFIPIGRILGWTLTFYIIIVEVLVTPMATMVAVAASAGIAIGFAAQDVLKNVFGGIMILFDRPFQVGDKIQVGDHYGEVKSIGLRTVRVQTPDDSLVSIPNSEIVSHSVSNANSGESNCQVVAEFYLPAGINLVKARNIAYQAAVVSRYAYLNKPVSIIIKNEVHQGRSLLKLRLKAYVLDIRYEFPFLSEMTEAFISEALRESLVTAEELSFTAARN